MEKLDPYIFEQILSRLQVVDQFRLCQLFPQFNICTQRYSKRDLIESGYERFDPRVRDMLITHTFSFNYLGETATELPEFLIPGMIFRQVADGKFLTFDGRIFHYVSFESKGWRQYTLDSYREHFDREKGLPVKEKFVKFLRTNDSYVKKDGKIYAGMYDLKVPFPVVDKVLNNNSGSRRSNEHYFSEIGQVYNEYRKKINGEPLPQELVESSKVVKAIRIYNNELWNQVEDKASDLLFLQENGNLIWTQLVDPSQVYAVDLSGKYVDIIDEDEIAYGLDRNGKVYRLSRTGSVINATLLNLPEKCGPVARIKFGLNGVETFTVINRFGQVYQNFYGGGTWGKAVENALFFDIDGRSFRGGFVGIGYPLDNYFEDAQNYQVSNIQRLSQDFYDNTLISYQLTDPVNERLITHLANVYFSGSEIMPAAIQSQEFYFYGDERHRSEVLEIVRSAIRSGPITNQPDRHGIQLYYFVDSQNVAHRIEVKEKDGQLKLFD